MKFLLPLFLIISTFSFAQSIEGIIKEKDNTPIVDANIINVRTGQHTHSDGGGRFKLPEVQVQDSLYITHLAYKSRYYIVEDVNEIKIIAEPSSLELSEVVISPSISSLNSFSNIDLKLDPVNSSQEVLRKVPGIIIGQHAGGGKAEQIFLRGFDIDHGTDVAISVNGMPVNMVSHAHGQGYADLHFLIPETIKTLDFGKGPYYAHKGNFTTAGYVNFITYDKITNNQLFQELGQFNTIRTVGLFNLLNKEDQNAYFAGEIYLTDGPFESPQDFNRINLMSKYNTELGNSRFTIEASHFKSDWNASGQIPMRAIKENAISRFGAIDDTEGGNTSRSNFQVSQIINHNKSTSITNRAFISHYDFELYSNFTFFLNDDINGDQIKQKESRTIYGIESIVQKSVKDNIDINGGLGFRHDEVSDNELSRTKNRIEILSRIALGDVKETNFYGFASADFTPGNWLINPSLRLDHFNFYYENTLDSIYNPQSEDASLISPKLNVIYSPVHNWQVYFKSGIGFHSNDTRVVVAQTSKRTLPKAFGSDLGVIWKPIDDVLLNVGLWYLQLEQEFVYVGDEGVVEPSGETRRLGIDVSARYQLNTNIFLNANVNYSYARALDAPENEDFIPLAPSLTSTGGIYYVSNKNFSGSIDYRYVGDRPANEDNSIVANGYFITDATLNYALKNIEFGVAIENIFNTEWNETQFATESRLQHELTGVEEIHFTPGTPFFIKGRVQFRF